MVGMIYCTRHTGLMQTQSCMDNSLHRRMLAAYRGQRAVLVCRHGPGPAQGCVHNEPVQRLIWPGLPVLVELVWQVLYPSGALKVDILLACRSGPSTHAAAAASLQGNRALKPLLMTRLSF